MEIANKLARLSILRTACVRDLPAGDRVTLARTLHYRDKATSFCMRGENYASLPLSNKVHAWPRSVLIRDTLVVSSVRV